MATTRVLVVDDDDVVRARLGDYLTFSGYAVVQAENAADAIAAINAQSPQVVLLDVGLRGMDDVRALQELRSVDEELPVIMLTPDDSPASRDLRHGTFHCVPKPFDLAYLGEVLAVALAYRRLRLRYVEPTAGGRLMPMC